jgi:hypothetical protein
LIDQSVRDKRLDDKLVEMLESGCEFKTKRSPKVLVSKQKFHSWGGKRNSPQKSTKIVIRNPFHSWGGKRAEMAYAGGA